MAVIDAYDFSRQNNMSCVPVRKSPLGIHNSTGTKSMEWLKRNISNFAIKICHHIWGILNKLQINHKANNPYSQKDKRVVHMSETPQYFLPQLNIEAIIMNNVHPKVLEIAYLPQKQCMYMSKTYYVIN